MREACGILSSDLSPDICSAELATRVHRRTYEILNSPDPYKEVKQLAMTVGLELEEKAKALIAQSDDKFRAAVLVAIVGNVLDFGIEGSLSSPEELVASFEAIYNEGLGHDDTDKIKKYLKKDAKILLLSDNCGEIVFDKLLCSELRKFGIKLTLAVKGEPILSDATLEEVEQINMAEVVDEIITTGEYAVGFSIKNLPSDLKSHLQHSDLIISKGMANFEALSETGYKPICYLLRTKCDPVASALGLPKNLNAAKLIE
jgi:uncharacterized protein with ATP-grasp and redox domains